MNNFGPSIGWSICWNECYTRHLSDRRSGDMFGLNEYELQQVVDYPTEQCGQDQLCRLWHRVAIVIVDRDHPRCYHSPSLVYKYACPEVQRLLQKRLQQQRHYKKSYIFKFLLMRW